MKLVRSMLLGAAASLLALGGVASTAEAAENPADPILCAVTSPDPSACSADPGGDEGAGPSGPEPAQSEEDPLCGLTAGLLCAPGGGGGEEPPGEPGGGEEPPGGPGGEEPPSGPSA